MAFIDYVLQTPSYGWKDEQNNLIVPTKKQLFSEAFSRVNIFRDKRNWMSALSWILILVMMPFFYLFVTKYFSLTTALTFVFYAMIIMGTHGTIWYHRYSTHKSYTFKNSFWRILTQNLVVKTFPEEVYVISHHVHHSKSDLPGDPYNARAGFWYCMLSDINHQAVNKELSEKDYGRAAHFMKHTGVGINSYEAYKKWGTVTSPGYVLVSTLLNWAFWYTVLYLVGGHGIACACFGAAMFWFVFVRAFNYTGHGKGEEAHVEGLDFDRSNLSVNQWRPGYFAGEWHNNHHLYPASARNGFLPGQLDVPWLYIKALHKIGAVVSYHDSTKDFLRRYGQIKNSEAITTSTIKNPVPVNS